MHPNHRIRFRAAERIHDQLVAPRSLPITPPLPEWDWQACQQLDHQFRRAQALGWNLAAAHFRRQREQALSRFSEALQATCSAFHPAHHEESPPSLGEINADLRALEQEFERVSIDHSERTLCVVTDRIALEGIDLGPFEIRLRWDQLEERHPYEVVALDPDPSRSDENTPHPHVRDRALCEGDGHVAIRRALRNGRLFDFFTIVDRILRTYNSGSPYVPLTQWYGQPCASCGEVISEDETSSCAQCTDILCGDCLIFCGRCDSACCQSCAKSCADCGVSICAHCECSCADSESTDVEDLSSEDPLSEEPDDEQHADPDHRDIPAPETTETAVPSAATDAA